MSINPDRYVEVSAFGAPTDPQAAADLAAAAQAGAIAGDIAGRASGAEAGAAAGTEVAESAGAAAGATAGEIAGTAAGTASGATAGAAAGAAAATSLFDQIVNGLVTLKRVVLGGETVTANKPLIDATQTWNNLDIQFTAWKLNITDTISNAQSRFIDLQRGGASIFRILKTGETIISNAAQTSLGGIVLRGSQGEMAATSQIDPNSGSPADVFRWYWEGAAIGSTPGSAAVIRGLGTNRFSIESGTGATLVHISSTARFEWEGLGSDRLQWVGYEAGSAIGKTIDFNNSGQTPTKADPVVSFSGVAIDDTLAAFGTFIGGVWTTYAHVRADGVWVVGNYGATSTDSGITLSRNLQDASTENGHGFVEKSYFRRGPNLAFAPFDAATIMAGYAFDHGAAFQDRLTIQASFIGQVTNDLYGLFSRPSIDAGNVLRRYAGYAGEATLVGGGTIDEQYGFFVAQMDNGATNWAFFSQGTTPSRLEGNVAFGAVVPTEPIHLFKDVDGYARARIENPNAGTDALAGFGLFQNAGDEAAFYVTSSTFDGNPDYGSLPGFANSMWIDTSYGLTGGMKLVARNGPVSIYSGDRSTIHFQVTTAGNIGVGTTSQFGGGAHVIGIANRIVAPGSTPTGGGVLFADAGALKWKGSSGTVTTVAPA